MRDGSTLTVNFENKCGVPWEVDAVRQRAAAKHRRSSPSRDPMRVLHPLHKVMASVTLPFYAPAKLPFPAKPPPNLGTFYAGARQHVAGNSSKSDVFHLCNHHLPTCLCAPNHGSRVSKLENPPPYTSCYLPARAGTAPASSRPRSPDPLR